MSTEIIEQAPGQATNKQDSSAATPGKSYTGGKFLTFFLGREEYGLEILKVQEIMGMLPVTLVPRTPKSIRGVINLRGKIIPIMDIRLRFGMDSIAQTDETCIIVVHAQNVEMGIIVDKVSEVLDISTKDIEPTPALGVDVDTDFILGVGKSEGKVKLLLDIDKVLSSREAVDIHAAAAAVASQVNTAEEIKQDVGVAA